MNRIKRKKQHGVTFADRDKLMLFLIRMTELTSRTYYKKVNWRIDAQPISIAEVEEELLAAFLLTFRHFHMQDSPTSIPGIRSILAKVAERVCDKETLDELRKIQETFDQSTQFAIRPYDLKGQWFPEISEDEVFDLFINCHYFHTDPRGAQFFFQMPEPYRIQNRKAFELSLFRHVRRLHAFIPLVTKYLNSPALPRGGFALSQPGDEGKGTVKITVPVNPHWFRNGGRESMP